MNIVVTYETKWGKELFYPVSEDAKFLSQFTGRPTLLKKQLLLAVEKGWNVHVVQNQFNFENFIKNQEKNNE